MVGAAAVEYAPMFDTVCVRTARNLPAASSASSASVTWSRPWPSLRKLSERSAIHFTGRPSRRAAQATSTCSG